MHLSAFRLRLRRHVVAIVALSKDIKGVPTNSRLHKQWQLQQYQQWKFQFEGEQWMGGDVAHSEDGAISCQIFLATTSKPSDRCQSPHL